MKQVPVVQAILASVGGGGGGEGGLLYTSPKPRD